MKNFQSVVLWVLVLGLIGYTIYDKKFNNVLYEQYQDCSWHQTQLIDFRLPERLYFADEPVPLEDMNVRHRLDREFYAFIFAHAGTAMTIRRANQWLPRFEKILSEMGVHTDFKYLPIIESNLMPQAVSPMGAGGLWQIMPEVAKQYGLEINEEIDERFHPIKSAYVAARILKENYQKFGSWALAAAAYNAGAGYLEGAISFQKQKSYYDLFLYPETARYVIRLVAFKHIYENPQKYGYQMRQESLYCFPPLRTIKIKENISDLVDFAEKNGVSYRVLVEYNPWIKGKTLSIKEGKTYEIELPYPSANRSEGEAKDNKDSLKKMKVEK